MNDIDVLARTLYGEARGEGINGMHAVANVVMNRLEKCLERNVTWWGTDVSSICLKKWQFSCWNKSDPNLAVIKKVQETDGIFSAALGLAHEAIMGNLDDITNGADSYYAKDTKEPIWAVRREPCAIIGNHLFYQTSLL